MVTINSDAVEVEETEAPDELSTDLGIPGDLLDDTLMFSMSDFLDGFGGAIKRELRNNYPPLYNGRRDMDERPFPRVLRKPMGAQNHFVRALSLLLEEDRAAFCIGQMGTGKTTVAAMVAEMCGLRNVVVACPPNLLRKWRREVIAIVPNVRVVIATKISHLEEARRLRETHSGPLYVIMASTTGLSLTYRRKASYISRYVFREVESLDYRGQVIDEGWGVDRFGDIPRKTRCCTGCGQPLLDAKDRPVIPTAMASRKLSCEREVLDVRSGEKRTCDTPMWEAVGKGADQRAIVRVALCDYIKKRMDGFFDLFIIDEAHHYKGQDSGRGIGAGVLAEACRKTLALTGTFIGGYSSTLFYLLWRFSPEIREHFGIKDVAKWIDRYGFWKSVYASSRDEVKSYGSASKSRGRRTSKSEMPGLSPAAMMHVLHNTVFMRLADVARDLPPYREEIVPVGMGEEIDPFAGMSQAGAYAVMEDGLKEGMKIMMERGDSGMLLGKMIHALNSWVDIPERGERVWDPLPEEDGGMGIIVDIPPMDPQLIHPKERELIDLVLRERAEGRNCLVYMNYTGEKRDTTGRLQGVLADAGINAWVMKSSGSNAERQTESPSVQARESWIQRRVKEGVDVLITNPRLVSEGLDLYDFPTIVWYQPEYSVYTMRQASARSWRIGQTRDVRVYFMYYSATMQERAVYLVAKKMRHSLAIEGDISDDALASLGDDGGDMYLTLAKDLVDGGADEAPVAGSLEELFAASRDDASADSGLILGADEDWWFDEEDEDRKAIFSDASGSGKNGVVRVPLPVEPDPVALDLAESFQADLDGDPGESQQLNLFASLF